jgi:hypothetical protein
LDKPSDKAPNGARGHRVILTRRAAEQALPSLIGMAVDYKVGWDGHDARQKIGVITTAEIIDNFIVVGGHVFGRDFPEAATKLEGATEMGMSYELADAHVEDMRQSIWTLTRATFTGAAVLFREKAAYRMTDFQLLEAA